MRLEGRSLSFRYGDGPWLFRQVDIAIESGQIVGLLGPSGSGKTTLGRLLAGYEQPLTGFVRAGDTPYPIAGYHPVQMVFQHPELAVNPCWKIGRILDESWSARAAPLPDSGGAPADKDADAWQLDVILRALGVEKAWMNRRPAELSGGELQRVCIARALAPGTRFLIADEMTAMLDAISQAQIWRAVLRIASARRLGLLVISHDRHLLSKLCDRIYEWPAMSVV